MVEDREVRVESDEAAATDFPPTIIVVHPKEKRSKCTVEPLRGRVGFVFWRFPRLGPEPHEVRSKVESRRVEKSRPGFDASTLTLTGYVRLGLGGPVLSEADAGRGLLVLDGTWRLAGAMESAFASVPVRTLPAGWETAYPRRSKLFEDPLGGLATIEAVYAAYTILGRDTAGLLDAYHWAEEFLALNAGRLTRR